jgi:hypothetical protein
VDGCELREIGYLQVPHIDGMWGSCAVYNDVTHLCFDEEGVGAKGCQTFDGNNQGIIDAESNSAHDWSSMAIYDNKMWVVGGCSAVEFGCHNIVEAFDGHSWSVSVPHAENRVRFQIQKFNLTPVYGFCITSWLSFANLLNRNLSLKTRSGASLQKSINF